jgi:hypothetical protein
VEPGLLLAFLDLSEKGRNSYRRRKDTGKEQTFLAYKTLLQFSWARSYQRPKPKLAHEVQSRSHSHGRNTWIIWWPLTAPLDLRRTNNSLIDCRY